MYWKSLWMSLYEIYLYGSVHIACVAFLIYYLYHYQCNDAFWEAAVFGGGTFVYYNLSRIVRIRNYEEIQGNEHLMWVSKNLTELIFALGATLISMILLSKRVNLLNVFPVYTCCLIIVYPFVRRIPFVKNMIISFVWVMCIFWGNGREARISLIVLIFLYFLFLSLLYDRKDKPENKGTELRYLFWVDLLLILPFIIFRLFELH